jgi:hypothetical protein
MTVYICDQIKTVVQPADAWRSAEWCVLIVYISVLVVPNICRFTVNSDIVCDYGLIDSLWWCETDVSEPRRGDDDSRG